MFRMDAGGPSSRSRQLAQTHARTQVRAEYTPLPHPELLESFSRDPYTSVLGLMLRPRIAYNPSPTVRIAASLLLSFSGAKPRIPKMRHDAIAKDAVMGKYSPAGESRHSAKEDSPGLSPVHGGSPKPELDTAHMISAPKMPVLLPIRKRSLPRRERLRIRKIPSPTKKTTEGGLFLVTKCCVEATSAQTRSKSVGKNGAARAKRPPAADDKYERRKARWSQFELPLFRIVFRGTSRARKVEVERDFSYNL